MSISILSICFTLLLLLSATFPSVRFQMTASKGRPKHRFSHFFFCPRCPFSLVSRRRKASWSRKPRAQRAARDGSNNQQSHAIPPSSGPDASFAHTPQPRRPLTPPFNGTDIDPCVLPQTQSPFLTKLPLELRRLVYERALGGRFLRLGRKEVGLLSRSAHPRLRVGSRAVPPVTEDLSSNVSGRIPIMISCGVNHLPDTPKPSKPSTATTASTSQHVYATKTDSPTVVSRAPSSPSACSKCATCT